MKMRLSGCLATAASNAACATLRSGEAAENLDKNLAVIREWRVSIIREKIQDLGRVSAADEEMAIAKATEEFHIEAARRFRLIVVPVE